MEKETQVRRTNWPTIEKIASAIVEDEMDILTRNELIQIENEIDSGRVFECKSYSGMAFDYATAISIVSVALTSVSLVVEYYKYKKTAEIKAEDVLKWILVKEGVIPPTMPKDLDSKIVQFIQTNINLINENIKNIDESTTI